jgi:hypothetical protein
MIDSRSRRWETSGGFFGAPGMGIDLEVKVLS